MELYKLTLKTSNRYVTGGTRCGLNVKITGENEVSTQWNKLGKPMLLSETLSKGSTEKHIVEHQGEFIGPPVILTLKLCGLVVDSWLCDYIVVEYEEVNYEFLVYGWIDKKEVTVIEGRAMLPQNVSGNIRPAVRKLEIEENKEKICWLQNASRDSVGWGINRHIDVSTAFSLPNVYCPTYKRIKCLGSTGLDVLYQTGSNILRSLFCTLKDFDDYKCLYEHLGCKDPYFIDCWKTDEEMGRQVLSGISPLSFFRCDKLPLYCNINDDTVKNILPHGKTLSSEMQAGKVYIADYVPYTLGVKRNLDPATGKQYVCADCVGIFYVRDDGQFVPIALQLITNDSDSIFTPLDTEYDWLLAKMYFRSTMQSIHEWIYHFLYTHGMSETFSVATFRCFPRSHPIYKLLRPHLSTAPAINTDARFLIFPDGSLANKSLQLSGVATLRKAFESFNLELLHIPKVLQKNGTLDRHLLPHFYYRDDALDIWEVLETYVRKVIQFYYKNDEDIQGDHELQGWAHDVAMEGFAWQTNDKKGVPDQIWTIDQLIEFCTIIIFTSSAQHAAVNFGQMETYQFVPNSPGAMRMPIHKRGEATLERIINTLPSITIASLSISFSYALSAYTQDEVFLGKFPERLFTEPKIIEIQNEFREDMQKLGEKFKKRNETVEHPYTYLLPENIPISVAI